MIFVVKLLIVQVDIWFKPMAAAAEENNTEEEETQPTASAVIDRVTCLRPVLFDMFADHTVDPPMLNYVEMVMRLCLRSSRCSYFLHVISGRSHHYNLSHVIPEIRKLTFYSGCSFYC